MRVIFMEDQIPLSSDGSLLFGRQTSKWSIWDVVFHENNSISYRAFMYSLCHFSI